MPIADPLFRGDLIKTFLGIGAKIIILSGVFAFLGLFFSNRIAGPVYRLSKDIIRMAENADLTLSFSLRDKDELQDVAIGIRSASPQRQWFIY
jgi:methyl-accepting chemotaxis protein